MAEECRESGPCSASDARRFPAQIAPWDPSVSFPRICLGEAGRDACFRCPTGNIKCRATSVSPRIVSNPPGVVVNNWYLRRTSHDCVNQLTVIRAGVEHETVSDRVHNRSPARQSAKTSATPAEIRTQQNAGNKIENSCVKWLLSTAELVDSAVWTRFLFMLESYRSWWTLFIPAFRVEHIRAACNNTRFAT